MRNGRWLFAGGLFLALILDFVVVRNAATHNNVSTAHYYGGLIGIILSVVVALALAARPTRGFVLAAVLLLFGWFTAFAAASLYATCDTNMRRFIWQLIMWFGPLFLVMTGAVLVVPFLLWGAGGLAYKFIRRPSTALITLLILASIPLVAVGTYYIETASGAHPTEGNCAI